ncbi:hypothetical protein O3M35_010089 [Rhynocoris fuscipes]|uniref:Lipase n=1 Tax=Rhynocoris fuscipes TaxID=488301 RepID=A0AAW1CXL8_9HEMI
MLFNRDFLKFIIFIYIFKFSLSQNSNRCDLNIGGIARITRVPPEKRSKLPPGFKTTGDIIKENGFGYKKYQGITEDGYILTYHRIITKTPGGQPVLFQIGLSTTSDCWLLTGRKTDLAFQLADAGYDVWLGDRRGNWYSREHVKYKPNSKEFWDFSFHESGMYDLPVFIDGIIHNTEYSKIIYVGHSMGCTEFFVLMSVRPEYNEKIKLAILLAPVAIPTPVQELKSPLLRASITLAGPSLYKTGMQQRLFELTPRDPLFMETLRQCCGPSDFQPICLTVFGLSFGEDRRNYNLTLMGDKLFQWPGGASLKTEYHITQIFKREFSFFDYGMSENLRRYNSTKPPMYPLERVTAPIAMYWGENDVFLDQKGIDKLVSRLPNVIKVHKVEDPMYNHMDFLWGLNTNDLVNYKLIDFLNNYND